jgi:SCP-2 sterol transfer family
VSSEPAPGRSLASYVEALFAELDERDPQAAQRIRTLAGRRTARIRLDDETVLTTFEAGRLRVLADDPSTGVDGTGATDRATVIDLLAGRIEAVDALLRGRVEIAGEPDAVVGMLQIIETLLDAAARTPALQRLERELTSEHRVEALPDDRPGPGWYPAEIPDEERALLARLDLLRDDPRTRPAD